MRFGATQCQVGGDAAPNEQREVNGLAEKIAEKAFDTDMQGMDELSDTLMGATYVTMDAKGRMSFPAKLRELIGERFIVTKGIDGCVYAYSLKDFKAKAEKLRELPMTKARKLQRSFVGFASVVEPDKQGRILIPQALRECADLTKEVVVAGVIDRCEIWSKERWDSFNDESDDTEGLDF